MVAANQMDLMVPLDLPAGAGDTEPELRTPSADSSIFRLLSEQRPKLKSPPKVKKGVFDILFYLKGQTCIVVSTVTVQPLVVHVHHVSAHCGEEGAVVRDDQHGGGPALIEKLK